MRGNRAWVRVDVRGEAPTGRLFERTRGVGSLRLAAGCAALLLSGCKGGGLGTESRDQVLDRLERVVAAGCEADCRASGFDGPTCGPVCECVLDRLYDERSDEQVAQRLTTHITNGVPDDELRLELEDDYFECAADAYDRHFLDSCVRGTQGGAPADLIRGNCECLLREIRGSMGRGEGTLWMAENFRGTSWTPDGFRVLHRARSACSVSTEEWTVW